MQYNTLVDCQWRHYLLYRARHGAHACQVSTAIFLGFYASFKSNSVTSQNHGKFRAHSQTSLSKTSIRGTEVKEPPYGSEKVYVKG